MATKPVRPSFNAKPAILASIPAGYETGETVFSVDGMHAATIAARDGRAVVFFDATMSTPFDGARDLVIGQGRGDYAFVAKKGDKESVVFGTAEGTAYDGIGRPLFGPDGRIFYEARQKEKSVVVWGGKLGAPFSSANSGPVVSSEGKTLAYAEQNPVTGKVRVRLCSGAVNDCVNGDDYDAITEIYADASRPYLVYLAERGGKKALVTLDLAQAGAKGKDGAWYDGIAMFGASSGGAHLAYFARRGDTFLLVRDGVEMPVPGLDSTFEFVTSPTGKTIYTGMVKNKVRAFVDGKPVGKESDEIERPIFSSDGNHYAFAVTRGSKSFVVVDGVEGPPFDKVVTPRFSPDGSRLVYRARQAGERFVVIADTRGRTIRECPHYPAVWDVSFSPDGKSVGYGTRIGQELWWKVESLQ